MSQKEGEGYGDVSYFHNTYIVITVNSELQMIWRMKDVQACVGRVHIVLHSQWGTWICKSLWILEVPEACLPWTQTDDGLCINVNLYVCTYILIKTNIYTWIHQTPNVCAKIRLDPHLWVRNSSSSFSSLWESKNSHLGLIVSFL